MSQHAAARTPGDPVLTFDPETHRRQRNTQLQHQVDFLDGERVRLERLLATVLLMASRTIGCDWRLILDAACTTIDTDPAKAHIHQ